MSIGWGDNKTRNAAKTPKEVAASLLELINKHGFDGFDIDYETVNVSEQDMLRLSQELRTILPKGKKLLTITPAQTNYLNKDITDLYDYVNPQAYQHDGNDTKPEPYANMLESWSKIVIGLNVEAHDNIDDFIEQLKKHDCAGLLCWRLGEKYKDDAVKEVWKKVKNS